jgi:nucleoside-triphosphatase
MNKLERVPAALGGREPERAPLPPGRFAIRAANPAGVSDDPEKPPIRGFFLGDRQKRPRIMIEKSRARKHLLFTGRPGIGKTTVIRKALENKAAAGGFFTEEIRVGGTRTGFSINTLDGRTGLLAGADFRSPVRVGRYGVNLKDIDDVAVSAIERALADPRIKVVVMDEIASMELSSTTFREAVCAALDGPKSIMGTIQMRKHPFLDDIRARPDVEIIEVTKENRGELPLRALDWLDRVL